MDLAVETQWIVLHLLTRVPASQKVRKCTLHFDKHWQLIEYMFYKKSFYCRQREKLNFLTFFCFFLWFLLVHQLDYGFVFSLGLHHFLRCLFAGNSTTEVNIKSCFPSAQCLNGSLNLRDERVTQSTLCCNTNNCNTGSSSGNFVCADGI